VAPEVRDLERLARVHRLSRSIARRQGREERAAVGVVARADRRVERAVVDGAVRVVAVRRAPGEEDPVGREHDGLTASGRDGCADDAVTTEERTHAAEVVVHHVGQEERAARGLVDARDVRDAADQREPEDVLVRDDLRAEQRRVDAQLVDLAHREHEAASELDVRIAGGDLEAFRLVGEVDLRGIDRIAIARGAVLLRVRLELRVGEVPVLGTERVDRGVDARAERELLPVEDEVQAIEPREVALIGGDLALARVEVLRDDGRLGHVEGDGTVVDLRQVDGQRRARDREQDDAAESSERVTSRPTYRHQGRDCYCGAFSRAIPSIAFATSFARNSSSPGLYPSRIVTILPLLSMSTESGADFLGL
jgi:hypothetical protein